MKYRIRKMGAFALLLALMASMVPGTGVRSGFRAEAKTAKKSADCKTLCGAALKADDLRGGAGLCLAALAAEGESRIEGVEYIDRGYEGLEETLSLLGADIRRVRVDEK